MEKPAKPLPEPSSWTREFWEAAREEKLKIQKCRKCGNYIFYPKLECAFCYADELAWVEVSGKGSVYSYTIVLNNAPSAFLEDMPYVVAIIRLEEGVQMLSNIVGCEPEEVYCEMPVEVTFEKLNEEFTLPKFKPAAG